MGLEEALDQQTARLAELIKGVKEYQKSLGAWDKALRSGNLVAMRREAEQSKALAAPLPARTEAVMAAWSFDLRDYLEGLAWREELQAVAANIAGLRVLPGDGNQMLAPPLVVRALPDTGRLRLGRVLTNDLRPSFVAQRLSAQRAKAEAAGVKDLLRSLYGVRPAAVGGTRKLAEAYERFCAAPGWKRDNSPEVFAQALYALDRADRGTRTLAGQCCFLSPPSTTGIREREVFCAVADDGSTCRYYTFDFA
jgi:hypothetical protein